MIDRTKLKLVHRGNHDPMPWALRCNDGRAVTNADIDAPRARFKLGDQVIEVNWLGDNSGWTHIDYGRIPDGNGFAKSGVYCFGESLKMEVTDGIVTALWKDPNDTVNKSTPLQDEQSKR